MTYPEYKKHLLLVGAVIGLFICAGLITLKDYGMGWDEVTRWNSGDLKLQYYQKLFSGETRELERPMRGDLYPGLFDLPLALWHARFGGNRMLQGHALSILFGALGLISTAWLANTLFGTRIAFISTFLLAIVPHFYGHAMMNPKDIPFMTAYTLGLAAVFSISKRLIHKEKIPWFVYVLTGLAIGMAGAARIPGLILLAFACAFWPMTILAASHYRGLSRLSPKLLFHSLKIVLLVTVPALLVVLAFFPRLHFQLFSGIGAVAGRLHVSANTIPLLFNGQVMDAGQGPLFYAHRFLLISTPLWMLALLFVGLGFLIHALYQRRLSNPQSLLPLLFLASAIFPWLYILISRPALHNGIRHMLFALPPLVIIMALGITGVLKFLQSGRGAAIARAWILLVAILCLFQITQLVRMHPYQYVSFNRLAGDPATIPNRYETEYWFTSTRHLLEILPVLAPMPQDPSSPIEVRVSGPLNAAYPFVPPGFALTDSFTEADYYLSNTTFRSDLLTEGEVVFQIQRRGVPIGVIKKLSRQ